MSDFVPKKVCLWGILLLYFTQKKSAAEAHRILFETYDVYTLSETTCKDWFIRFKNNDFDIEDKEHSGTPKKFEDEELEVIFVAASHQTGLDMRSMTQRLIKVGIKGGGGQAWAEAWLLVTMMHLAHPKVAQPKLGTLWPQVYLCWTGLTGEPVEALLHEYSCQV